MTGQASMEFAFKENSPPWRSPGGQVHTTVLLPADWELFAVEPFRGNGEMVLPECKCVHLGAPQNLGWVWKAFSSYSTHRYALGRRVAVPMGCQVELLAWVWSWSSEGDDPMVSVNGSYRTRIGVDPFGGTDWRSPDIVWSHEEPGRKVMDKLIRHEVVTAAEAGKITLWLWGDSEWRVKHNDAYWSGAWLYLSGDTPPPTGDLEQRVAQLEQDVAALCELEGRRTIAKAFGTMFVVEE